MDFSDQVSWELRPRHEKRAESVVRSGFQLELFARGPTLADDPASAECRAAYERLVATARLALPPDLVPVAFLPHDRSFHLAAGKEAPPEIELLVEIGPFAGEGAAEAERVARTQVEAALRRLGIRRRGEPQVERRPERLASIPAVVGCASALRAAPEPGSRGAGSRFGESQQPMRRVA
jgi:hypothetical protein